ncbi:MAG: hypothetical protein AB1679_31680 [Actinomycetota bacterium]
MALTVAALGLSACGDDGGSNGEAPAGASPSTGPVGERTIGPKDLFCNVIAQIDAPFTEAGQYASREQKVEAAKKVADLLDGAAKVAPPDIAAAAKAKLDAIRTAAGGEPSALIDSEALDATQKIKDYCPA